MCCSSSPGLPSKQKAVWLTIVWFKESIYVETTRASPQTLRQDENSGFPEIFFVKSRRLLTYITHFICEHVKKKHEKLVGYILCLSE